MVSKPLAGVGGLLSLVSLGLLVSVMVSENFVVVTVPGVPECDKTNTKFSSFLGTLGIYTATFDPDCAAKAKAANPKIFDGKTDFTSLAKAASPTTEFAPLFPAQTGFGLGGPKLDSQTCEAYYSSDATKAFATGAGFKGTEREVAKGVSELTQQIKQAAFFVPSALEDLVRGSLANTTATSVLTSAIPTLIPAFDGTFTATLSVFKGTLSQVEPSASMVPSGLDTFFPTLTATLTDATKRGTFSQTCDALFGSAAVTVTNEDVVVDTRKVYGDATVSYPTDTFASVVAATKFQTPTPTPEQIAAIKGGLKLASQTVIQLSASFQTFFTPASMCVKFGAAEFTPVLDCDFRFIKSVLESKANDDSLAAKGAAVLGLCGLNTTAATCDLAKAELYNKTASYTSIADVPSDMCRLVLSAFGENIPKATCTLNFMTVTLSDPKTLFEALKTIVADPVKKIAIQTLLGVAVLDEKTLNATATQLGPALNGVFQGCKLSPLSYDKCGSILPDLSKELPAGTLYNSTEAQKYCSIFRASVPDCSSFQHVMYIALSLQPPPKKVIVAPIAPGTPICVNSQACTKQVLESNDQNSIGFFQGNFLKAVVKTENAAELVGNCTDDITDIEKFSTAQAMVYASAPLLGLGGVLALVALAANKGPVAWVGGMSTIVGAGVLLGALMVVRSAPVYALIKPADQAVAFEPLYQAGQGQLMAIIAMGVGVIGGSLTMVSGCLNKGDVEDSMVSKVDQTY